MAELSDDQQKAIEKLRKAELSWRWQRHVSLWAALVMLVLAGWLLVSIMSVANTYPLGSPFRSIAVPVGCPLLLISAGASLHCIWKAVVYWRGDPIRTLLLTVVDRLEGSAG